jgi:hypothetical protein
MAIYIDPFHEKLEWTPGENIAVHHIYFGSNPKSLNLIGITKDAQYDKLPKLNRHHWYCWRVDAETADGSIHKGDLWAFHTGQMIAWWKLDESHDKTIMDSSSNALKGRLMGDAKIISDPERACFCLLRRTVGGTRASTKSKTELPHVPSTAPFKRGIMWRVW